MDCIEGENLIEYVRYHDLTIREKLNLFFKICAGVYAGNGDLKLAVNFLEKSLAIT
jgi:hypothetical protein